MLSKSSAGQARTNYQLTTSVIGWKAWPLEPIRILPRELVNLKQNLLVTVVFRESEEASVPETVLSGTQLFQLERARSRDEEKGEWGKSRDSMVVHVDM